MYQSINNTFADCREETIFLGVSISIKCIKLHFLALANNNLYNLQFLTVITNV